MSVEAILFQVSTTAVEMFTQQCAEPLMISISSFEGYETNPDSFPSPYFLSPFLCSGASKVPVVRLWRGKINPRAKRVNDFNNLRERGVQEINARTRGTQLWCSQEKPS